MGSPGSGFRRLLEAPDAVEADLARNLLESAGIPSILHGQDRDFAELGQAGHMRVARPDLYVPARDFVRARHLLDEAWDRDALSDDLVVGAPVDGPPGKSIPVLFFKLLFVVCLAAAIFVTYLRLASAGAH